MQYAVERKIAYYRALLVESFMKDDAVRYEFAVEGLRGLLARHSPLSKAHKRKYRAEFDYLTKKGKQYFSDKRLTA